MAGRERVMRGQFRLSKLELVFAGPTESQRPFMPRQLRIEYSGAIYHVMNRGDRREPIFGDDADRKRFLETLGEECAKTEWRLHAYRLMGDHFHLALATPRPDIRCRGAPSNTNNMGMHRKLAGPELFQGASGMGRGRPRPRVLSGARRFTGTSRPRPFSFIFMNAHWELFDRAILPIDSTLGVGEF